MKLRKPKRIETGSIKRVLFLNPFGIGDVLFTTPLVRTLREFYPNNYIGFICNRRTQYLVENNPHVDEVFVFEKDEYRVLWKSSKIKFLGEFSGLLKAINKRKFDICFDLSMNMKYGFFLKMLKIPVRLGYDFKNRGRFLTHRIKIDGYHDKSVIEYYLDLARYMGIEPKSAFMDLYLNEKDMEWADSFQRENFSPKEKFVCLSPAGGESWGSNYVLKHWYPEKFSELVCRIRDELDAKVIFLSSPRERRIISQVKFLIEKKDGVIDLSGRTSLGQCAAIIKKCSVLVSNDGGPIHIAKSLGVPTVSIFGPVDDKVYGPYPLSDRDKVVKEDISCRPCYRNFRLPECRNNRKCLSGIGVDKVFDAVKSLMADTNSN